MHVKYSFNLSLGIKKNHLLPITKLADEILSTVLHQKLDLDEITAVLRTRRLRWYGHVHRATSCLVCILKYIDYQRNIFL